MGLLKYVNASAGQFPVAQLAYSDASGVLHEAASAYIGSTLVFSKGYTGTWVTIASGLCFLASFTPTVNMSLASFSMILSTSTQFNYTYGIWSVSGSTATPVTNAVGLNSTNTSVVNVGTLSSTVMYKHTKTYVAGSRPALLAGVTYYFHVGDRYSSTKVLSGTATYSGYVQDWAISTSSAITFTSVAAGSNLLLEVVAA